jgi:2-oxoglutarate ferredoxin oxidoreductase subunit alpha
MRGGPGLGGIAGAQGDYFQATRGGGNGDYRTIVLAPSNAQEMADFTIEAFDLADKYRIVVIILADGYLGQMSEALVLPEPSGKTFEKPWALTGRKGRAKNLIASMRLVPDTALEEHNLHLQEKYDLISQNERRADDYLTDDAEWLIVAYGTSARVSRKAVDRLRAEGVKVGLFRPQTLWPFPDQELREAAEGCGKVLAVEMSLGQMVEDVKLALNGAVEVDFHGRAGGAVPALNDIIERINSYERANHSHVQAS